MNMTPALDQQTKYQKIQNIAYNIVLYIKLDTGEEKLSSINQTCVLCG